MKVILPVKDESLRLPDKNFKDFYSGLSLCELKVKQLLKTFEPDEILVFTHGDKGKRVADTHGILWIEDSHIDCVEDTFPFWIEHSHAEDFLILTYATAPLFDFYREIVLEWNRATHDSIFAAVRIKKFITDAKGRPLNFQYGYHHLLTQDLPEWYSPSWSCFVIDAEVAKKARYCVGRSPQIYVPPVTQIDVDSQEDFEVAQVYYCRTQYRLLQQGSS